MELYQVRSFVAVSRFFNFTPAAEHCNGTQPVMTKAVQNEYELGRLSCDALGHCYTRISDCGGCTPALRPHDRARSTSAIAL